MSKRIPAKVKAERDRWIRRYIGLFGEPPQLSAYNYSQISFRELYDSALRTAELMLAEAQSCQSIAFEEEPE